MKDDSSPAVAVSAGKGGLPAPGQTLGSARIQLLAAQRLATRDDSDFVSVPLSVAEIGALITYMEARRRRELVCNDLVEALKTLVEGVESIAMEDELPNSMEKARAAIAKASA